MPDFAIRESNYEGLSAVRQVVINWHLTAACNYGCRHCYSRWCSGQMAELYRHPEKSISLLSELVRFFSPHNLDNPIQSRPRFSLAGGEPLLFPEHTLRIAKETKALGSSTSLITNGSLLTPEIVGSLAPNLAILGISLDSANPETNRQIGREDRAGRVLCIDNLAGLVAEARRLNPVLEIKINTVVNAQNANEDLNRMIGSLKPDKWKILRVLPVVTDDLSISDRQFDAFVARHRHFGSLLCVEDNRDMIESYIMVDPHGRFFQNRANPELETPYIYSEPILAVGAATAFSQIPFDAEKFASRYGAIQSPKTEAAA